jgi:alpha-beta hydrolase superfamily lysophospholipase
MRTLLVLVIFLFASLPASAKVVKIKTADGLSLQADWHPPTGLSHGVILAFHRHNSNRGAWTALVPHLKAEGMGLLALDLRGHGGSAAQKKGKALKERVKARDPTLYAQMNKDVAAAMKFLKRKRFGAAKVVFVGEGSGCSVALQYAATHKKVKAAVLLSPAQRLLGVDTTAHIKKWGARPLLLVTSRETVESGAKPLYKALPDKKRAVLLMLPQSKIYGADMFGRVPGIEQRVVEWSAIQVGKSLRP